MATQKLAIWSSTLVFSSLPNPVIEAATRCFQNSLGCILGGANHPTTQRALGALKPLFQSRSCTLLGQHGASDEAVLCDLQNAALINGIASHVHDYDDTHLHTVIHPAGAVVVSLIAYAEYLKVTSGRKVSGKEFITSVTVGIEIGLRLGNAVSPNHYDEGWHITGTVSPIAVAAALSNLLRLSAEQTVNAIGIASAQPVGIRVHFGTDTKPLHVGRAAQNGILAAVLAANGVTAASDALEGRRGWVEVLGNEANGLQTQVRELTELTEQARGAEEGRERNSWEIENNTFKPFPCGIVIHPTIDGCLQLHNEQKLVEKENLDQIDYVHLRVHPLVLDLTGKKRPKDGLEAKFSVYHGAAIGLVLGSATPAEYEDEVVKDPKVLDVRSKVVAKVDGGIGSDEAVIVVTMTDGKTVEKHVEHSVGSLQRPMTNNELTAKFLRQVAKTHGEEKAQKINQKAWNVLDEDDIINIFTQAY